MSGLLMPQDYRPLLLRPYIFSDCPASYLRIPFLPTQMPSSSAIHARLCVCFTASILCSKAKTLYAMKALCIYYTYTCRLKQAPLFSFHSGFIALIVYYARRPKLGSQGTLYYEPIAHHVTYMLP